LATRLYVRYLFVFAQSWRSDHDRAQYCEDHPAAGGSNGMNDDTPDFMEQWEITIEHVNSGRTGMHTLLVDQAIPPDLVMRDLRDGFEKAVMKLAYEPWYRVPDEDGEE
jgi:hypothetical protein